MKRVRNIFLSFMLILCVSVCGIGAAAPTEVSAAESTVSTVKINKSAVTLIKGQKKQLSVVGTKEKVLWKSSKKSVAAVSSTGKVTAKKKGTALITAKVNGKSYRCKVTVQKPSLSKKSLALKVGSTYKLKLTGTNQKVIWRSSNKKIATVSVTGKVTAKTAGTCTITAKVLGKAYRCSVTVRKSSAGTNTSATVWLSATGTKYHKIPNCGRMNPNNARKISLSEAVSRGYEPCSKCF